MTEKSVGKKMLLQLIQGVIIALAVSRAACGARLRPKRQIRIIARRCGSLFVEESLKADLLNMSDKVVGRTERGLFKEANGIGF